MSKPAALFSYFYIISSSWLVLLLVGKACAQDSYYPVNETTYEDEDVFQQDILNTTNWFRDHYNATELTWNDTLVDFAQAVVKKCIFKHSGGPYGENLASGYTNASAAISAWGNESKHYNYGKPGFSESTGHFTQLVWTNTTSVGCARKNCSGATGDDAAVGWFVVCEYYPRGNFIGQFQYNVNKPQGSAATRLFGSTVSVLSAIMATLSAILISALL